MGKGPSCIFVAAGRDAGSWHKVPDLEPLLEVWQTDSERTGSDSVIVGFDGFPAKTVFVETNFGVQLFAFGPPR